GQVVVVQVLMSNRREDDEARSGPAVVFLSESVLDEVVEVLLELIQTFGTGEGFIVAEEGEDDVGLAAREPLIGAAEVGGAESQGQLVAGKAEITEDEAVPGESAVQVGLKPAVVLHAIGERVTDDANMIALPQLEL